MTKLGVIGGSGLYQIDGLEDVREVEVATPFGPPSDAITLGRLGACDLAFLPRHARGHRLLPSELPFRANIWALKSLGVEGILAISAVGSMRDDIAPGDLVIIDQFIDRTRHRADTFFGEGIAAHVHFADPVCSGLADLVHDSAVAAGATVHKGGTYLCMEGPQFSTRAESRLYRSWGVSVIGMTNVQEAKLAREACLCFATLALATDYDCWHETEEDVKIDSVIQVIRHNAELAKEVVHGITTRLTSKPACDCAEALDDAILTPPELVPPEVKKRLAPILPPRWR